MTGRIALAAMLVCAMTLAAFAQVPGNAPVGRKSDLQSKLAKQPLTFFLARGREDSCGPGCREWIAADGQFDAGSAARFRAFLARARLDKARPGDIPVFFNSNGGLQDEAMAIGRIMRERGMRAGIAVTRPEICGRKPESPAVCDTAKKSGRALASEWTSFDANCNSACGIALIGAMERWIPPAARSHPRARVLLFPAQRPHRRAEGRRIAREAMPHLHDPGRRAACQLCARDGHRSGLRRRDGQGAARPDPLSHARRTRCASASTAAGSPRRPGWESRARRRSR